MKPLKNTRDEYLESLRKRSENPRVHTDYQLLGLEIADILNDKAHKSLYIKLAKDYNPDMLLRLAKSVEERKNVKNKGAYFMKVLEIKRKEQ
jgi:hypothetical protein